MSNGTVKVDRKGRIIIPKEIRKTAKPKKGSYATIKSTGKTITIKPTESVADKYYGTFKIDKWPENIDEFTVDLAKIVRGRGS